MFNTKIHPYWAFIISSILTATCFHVIIGHLNTAVFSETGDGIKNLYAYLYYILFDNGIHFSGMNYPYGEHVTFTDNMPLLASIVKEINIYFPSTISHNITILNILLLSSFPIATVFLYKIMRLFIAADVWSLFAALWITFTAPMFIRISGHFGMAFIYYVPMMVYYLMRWHYTQRLVYIITITTLTAIFSFIHLYNLALSMLLMASYLIISSIYYRRNGGKYILQKAIGPLFSMIIPMIIAQGFLKITDWVQDRNGHPYGVFGGGTTGNDILVSNYAPFGKALSFIFGKSPEWPREGYLYLGIVAFISIISMIAIGFLRWFNRKKSNSLSYALPIPQYHLWLWVAGLCLLIGMGFPIQSGMYFLTDYISSLRQFRTVGRFSWIFYIIVQVYIFLYLYHAYYWSKQQQKLNPWRPYLATLSVILLVIQSLGIYNFFSYLKSENQEGIYNNFTGKTHDYNLKAFLESNNKNVAAYQSMLFLPYYHIGSEKVWVHDAPYILFNSMSASIQTGLPISNVMMSRTSLQQTFDNIALDNGVLANWDILQQYNEKPFLVFIDTAQQHNDTYTAWKHTGQLLGQWLNYHVYECTAGSILSYQRNFKDSLLTIINNNTENLGVIKGTSINEDYLYHSFDESTNKGIAGNAYFPTQKINRDTIAKFTINHLTVKDTLYSFSAWTKVAPDDYSSPVIVVEQMNASNERLSETVILGSKSTYVIDYWMLLEGDFKLLPNAHTLLVTILNDDKLINKFIAVDEVLIHPKSEYFFKKSMHSTWINNRPIAL